VTADGYLNPLDPTPPVSRLEVAAELGITEILDDGTVIIPPTQSGQLQWIMDLEVFGDWWGVGTIAGQDLFRTSILEYSGLYVPANGRLQLDLSCEVLWNAIEGGCQFLAGGGHGRQVIAPGVFLATEPGAIT
jgi:hypothetical protein